MRSRIDYPSSMDEYNSCSYTVTNLPLLIDIVMEYTMSKKRRFHDPRNFVYLQIR